MVNLMENELNTEKKDLLDDLKNILENSTENKTEEKDPPENSKIISKDEINCINTLMNISPHIICLKDPEGKWIKANDALIKILNLQDIDYEGKKNFEIKELKGKKKFEDLLKAMEMNEDFWDRKKNNNKTVNITESIKKDKTFEFFYEPVFYQDGKRKGMLFIGREITSEIVDKDKIQEREALLQTILSATPAGIAHIKNRVFQWVNKEMLNMLGYSEDELIGDNERKLYKDEKEFIRVGLVLYSGLRERDVTDIETHWLRKDGVSFTCSLIARPVDVKDSYKGLILVARDITERKKLEDEIKYRKMLLETQYNEAWYGILIEDTDGRFISCNKAFKTMWNIPEENIEKKDYDKILKKIIEQIENSDVFQKKSFTAMENSEDKISDEFFLKDGRVVNRFGVPLKDENNKYFGRTWFYRDITEIRKSEKEIIESEMKIRSLLNSIKVPILALSYDMIVLYCNTFFEDFFAKPVEEIIDKSILKIIPDFKKTEFYKKFISVIKKDKIQNVEVHFNKKDYFVQIHPSPLGIISIFEDVTEFKEKQIEILKKERKYEEIFNLSSNVIILTDREENIVDINKAVLENYGYTVEEIKGKKLSEISFISKTSLNIILDKYKIVLNDEDISSFELEVYERNGKSHIVLVDVIITRDEKYNVKGILFIFKDISELKKEQEVIKKTTEQYILENISQSVITSLSNILSPILLNLSYVKDLSSKNDIISTILTDNEYYFKEAEKITENLLVFSKFYKPFKNLVPLKNLIKQISDRAIDNLHILIDLNIYKNIWNAYIDAEMIKVVLYNILKNSCSSFDNNSRVKIKAENIFIHSGNTLTLTEGKYVKISIEDNRFYLSNKNIGPYFSGVKGLSDLILAMCKTVINKHNGHIDIVHSEEKKIIYEIYLPASERPAEILPKKEEEEEKSALAKGSKILIFDDEEDIKFTLDNLLRIIRYEVVSVDNEDELFDMYEEAMYTPKPFDMVIIDSSISGGIGWRKLMKKLLELDKKARVLISCQYFNDLIISNYKKYGFKGVITKPFDVDLLEKTLSRVSKRSVILL